MLAECDENVSRPACEAQFYRTVPAPQMERTVCGIVCGTSHTRRSAGRRKNDCVCNQGSCRHRNRFDNGIRLHRGWFVFHGKRNCRTEKFAQRTGIFIHRSVIGRLLAEYGDTMVEEVPMQSRCCNKCEQIQSEHTTGDELIEPASLGHCLKLSASTRRRRHCTRFNKERQAGASKLLPPRVT